MTTYTTKEKLLAIQLLGMAKQSVAGFLSPNKPMSGTELTTVTERALTLAAEYARTGADYSVLAVLEYPDLTKATS